MPGRIGAAARQRIRGIFFMLLLLMLMQRGLKIAAQVGSSAFRKSFKNCSTGADHWQQLVACVPQAIGDEWCSRLGGLRDAGHYGQPSAIDQAPFGSARSIAQCSDQCALLSTIGHFLFHPFHVFGHVAGQQSGAAGGDFEDLVDDAVEEGAVVADENDSAVEIVDRVLENFF